MRILLVAGSPCPSSSVLVRSLADGADVVMAVDRGAEACRAGGVVPDAFCGDGDTVSAETLAWVRSGGYEAGGAQGWQPPVAAHHDSVAAPDAALTVTPADDVRDVPEIRGLDGRLGVRVFPPAKYDTDLSLGFSCARTVAEERDEALEVTVTCASGGRMDHALSVFGVLAANADLAPVLVEDGVECRVLSPRGRDSWAFGQDSVGRHFSFVALADGTVVSERGMRWELDHFRVDALRDRGISNVIDAPDACITCHEGILAAFLV